MHATRQRTRHCVWTLLCLPWAALLGLPWAALLADDGTNWPAFRGAGGRGIASGFPVRTAWNADAQTGENVGVLWRTDVPGLGHSSPTVFGDKLFLATAVASHGQAPLKVGAGGEPTAADDNGEQSWVVLCYNKFTGQEMWRKTARTGVPRATRHAKATHANTSVVVDGKHVVAFFGSEGLYCYDLAGELLWQRDLGVVDISKYGIGWGYASSPAIFEDRVVLVCDDPNGPYIVALGLAEGQELWRKSREGDCERSWGTPLIHVGSAATQVVVNGWPWIVSYELETGSELWRIRGGGDNPIPTPFEAGGRIYITNAHGAESPIFALRPDARGDLSASAGDTRPEAVVWSTRRGGSYMSTPVVHGDYLYLGNTNGVIRCFHAVTGEKIYEQRLDDGASIIASLVAADDKIYCASENGTVYVLKAGPDFEVIARNVMGEPCFATPAISAGVLYIRTTGQLFAIK